MLYIILGFILLIIGGGFIYWFISTSFISKIGTIMTSKFPKYYGTTELTFIEAIDRYMLLFLLIGALIWLITSAQRTHPVGHYE